MNATTAIDTVLSTRISLGRPGRPFYMKATLIASDMLALIAAVAIGLILKYLYRGDLDITSYVRLWPFLAAFPIIFAWEGLYSGIALSPPEELRRATLSCAAIFMLLAAATVSLRGATKYFTWTLFVVLGLSNLFIPLFRAIVRRSFAGRDWWGYPAIVFGTGESARRVIKIMQREQWLGLKPAFVVDDSINEDEIEGVPVLHPRQLEWKVPDSFHSFYGVLALSGSSQERLKSMIETYGDNFKRLLVIPDLVALSSLWVNPRSFGGMLGLETHQHVLSNSKLLGKRLLDVVLTVGGGVFLLPLVAAIALWIRMDSPGPVFYGHKRIGRGRREFPAWKFRSMVTNGDEVLRKLLESDPAAREEWERNQKLRNDPRVTRVGRFLRRTSLDELPQLWNVVRGEMSLVGPRPIVQAEVVRYGNSFDLYTRVDGGVTGLWQVSGRNDTSYEERVTLDSFYVRNWSVWLDLCILFQTVGVVLIRRGAY